MEKREELNNAGAKKGVRASETKVKYEAPKLTFYGNLNDVVGKSGATFEFGGSKRAV